MARETKKVSIDGSDYIITQLGAVAGRGLSKRFVNAMVPVLRDAVSASVFDAMKKAVAGLPEDAGLEQSVVAMLPVIGPPLLDAVKALPDQLFEELCQVFSENCKVLAGKPATAQPLDVMFDDHFAAQYLAMYGWFIRCLAVNGFLVNLGAAIKSPPVTASTE